MNNLNSTLIVEIWGMDSCYPFYYSYLYGNVVYFVYQ